MSELSLASEFPAPTREAWRALVERVLKGADFDKKLVARTYDGIGIEPLYAKAEAAEPVRHGTPSPWSLAQRVDHPDPAEANALALADLDGGSDALVLVLDGAPTARGFGVRAADAADLDRALSGVRLDLISLSMEAAPFAWEATAASVSKLAERQGHRPGDLRIHFGLDPVGDLARAGSAPLPWSELSRRFAEVAGEILQAGFAGSAARIDTRPYHEAGASEAQELAAALATGVTYLRTLETGGQRVELARDALSFLLVADADEFLTVAKLRALRRCWARIEAACGVDPKPLRLHVETAWRMTTRRDPWVNLLRGTMAAFSAGIGGADSVTILPFTAALGLPDAFARRLARNTQTILLEEANVWRVTDPVAGAGGFEALTEALAAEAWTRFTEIEREGGIVESLRRGAFHGRIAETRVRREAAVATRRDAITGTSEFPDIREAPVGVLLPSPLDDASHPRVRAGVAREPAGLDTGAGRSAPSAPREQIAPVGERPLAGRPLPSVRSAEPYERLRDRSDEVRARTGSRPRIFLANLGSISAFSARALFAKNAFEAGGIEAVTNDGFSDLQALADAYRASGAELACLCSSDEIYAREAAPAAAALREVGAGSIYLAGRPGELESALREAGVTEFVFAGSNLPELLGEALDLATEPGRTDPG